jgi:hypothetical protein
MPPYFIFLYHITVFDKKPVMRGLKAEKRGGQHFAGRPMI